MTLALGIDPGTATTGYGLVRLLPDGELVAVSFGIISTPKEATPSARLEMLFDDLNKLLKKYKPDTAAVEKLFFSSNVKTALAVGQARGVVMLCIQKAGIEPFEYTPNEVKQAVAGYGGADKTPGAGNGAGIIAIGENPKTRRCRRRPGDCDHTFEYKEILGSPRRTHEY